MDRSDPCTSQHREYCLRDHWHVNDDAIAKLRERAHKGIHNPELVESFAAALENSLYVPEENAGEEADLAEETS